MALLLYLSVQPKNYCVSMDSTLNTTGRNPSVRFSMRTTVIFTRWPKKLPFAMGFLSSLLKNGTF